MLGGSHDTDLLMQWVVLGKVEFGRGLGALEVVYHIAWTGRCSYV